jgi:alginate O-acetyltransferase complex protein AlgI
VDLRRSYQRVSQDWGLAGQRIVIGLFKKFVIADSLALFALNASNASQVDGWPWAWILLYAFSLQIYFDFSGYTDIAIGLGHLMGFKLPENFNSPYLQPNITQFWNTWHMSLTQWFRAYYFNPLTRSLRTLKKPLSIGLIMFITQLSTMVLIGLWHGVSWNFIF